MAASGVQQWIGYITSIPEDLKQQLLDRIETEDIQQARRGDPAAVLAAVADTGVLKRLFPRLCAVRKEMLDAPNERHELAFAVQRQIVALLRELPTRCDTRRCPASAQSGDRPGRTRRAYVSCFRIRLS